MRRNLILFGFIACQALFSTPIDAMNAPSLKAADIERASSAPKPGSSSGTLAFFTDVKRTIFEIPEPATLLLLGTGLAVASRVIQRRRRSL